MLNDFPFVVELFAAMRMHGSSSRPKPRGQNDVMCPRKMMVSGSVPWEWHTIIYKYQVSSARTEPRGRSGVALNTDHCNPRAWWGSGGGLASESISSQFGSPLGWFSRARARVLAIIGGSPALLHVVGRHRTAQRPFGPGFGLLRVRRCTSSCA